MLVERVTLDPYGAFSGRTVDLGPGLTVVVGPNESGKSTLMAAIADLLWGIAPRAQPMAFRVRPNQLRLSASVRDADGERRNLVVTSRGCVDSGGGSVDPWWTSGEIRGRDAWRSALGLDRSALVSGGRAVLDSGGDLAPLLFRARTGVDLSAVAEQLEARAHELYKSHRGNRAVQVRVRKGAYESAREASDQAISSAATVELRRSDEESAVSAAGKADSAYAAADERKAKAEEMQRAWHPAHEVNRLRGEIGDLQHQGRVLDRADLSTFEDAEEALGGGQGAIAAAEKLVTDLQRRRDGYADDEVVLPLGERVDDLIDREPTIKDARRRLGELRDERALHRAEIRKQTSSVAPDQVEPLNNSAADDEQFLTTAVSLLLPEDVIARIEAEEVKLRSAEEKVVSEQSRLEDANADVEDAPDDERVEGDGIEEARRRRDGSWQRVRGAWLSGSLPNETERQSSAQEVDDALVGTDVAADAAIQRARGAGQDEGRRAALAAALTTAERRLSESIRDRDAARVRWRELLVEAGLPSVLDPDAWLVRRQCLEALAQAMADLADGADEAARLTGDVEGFDGQVTEACAAAASPGAAIGWVTLKERLLKARQAVQARSDIAEQLKGAEEERGSLIRSLALQKGVLDGLARPGEDLAEVVERSRETVRLTGTVSEELRRVSVAARPDTDREELIRRAGELTEADAELAVEGAEEELRRAASARDAARDRKKDAIDAREASEREGDAAYLNSVALEAAEALAGTVEEYLELLLAASLVRRMAEREGPQEDDALLAHAATIARRLTDGRVTDISVDTDGGTSSRLRVVADGLEDGTAAEMSEGTADQVFLALRLAGIRAQQDRSRQSGHVSLPVVLDDVLMAHDDARTEFALRTLLDEARDQQIILTTHHLAVADAARRLGATVTELDPLPDQVIALGGSTGVERDRGELDPATIRAWARTQGLAVTDRGRIAGWIVEAYRGRATPDLEE